MHILGKCSNHRGEIFGGKPMKYLKKFANRTAAGLLIGGTALGAGNAGGSVQPIAGEPAYTCPPDCPGATAGSMDLGRGREVTTPQSAESSGM